MSQRTIEQKQERKNALIREASELIQRDGLKSKETRERHAAITTELETLETTLRLLTRVDRSIASTPKAPIVNVTVPDAVTTVTERSAEQTASDRARLNKAFRAMLIEGRTSELRDIVNGTDSQGQALLAQLYSPEWTEALKSYAPIASQLSVTHAVSSAPVKVAAYDDTANLPLYLDPANVNGASFLSLENDPANIFSTTSAATDALVTSLVYSKQFAQSGIPNLETWLKSTLFKRIVRGIELALLTGQASYWNGTTVTTTALPNVQGIIPALIANGSPSVGISGVSYANSDTIGPFLSLLGSLDPAYQANASFLVTKNTYAKLLTVLDQVGRPLFALDESGVMRVNGKAIYPTSQAAVSAGAGLQLSDYNSAANGAPFILAGDFSLAGHWIDGGGPRFQVFTERAIDIMDNIGIAYSNVSSASTVTNLSVKSATSAGA